jgi:hypothetical protein
MCSSLRAKCDKERPCARCLKNGHASLCSSVTDRMAPKRLQIRQRESMLGTLRAPVEETAKSVDRGEPSQRGGGLWAQTCPAFDAGGHLERSQQMSKGGISALVAFADRDGDSWDESGVEVPTEARLVEDGGPDIVKILSTIDTWQATTHMMSGVGLWTVGRTASQVLEDVAACLRNMNVEADGALIDLSCLLSSHGIFVMEVEDSARWIIRGMGQGAAMLMHGASRVDAIGRSLAEFVRCEDVIRFRSMWPSDSSNVGAQLPPRYRIWIRCCPRESGLGKRKRCGSPLAWRDGGLVSPPTIKNFMEDGWDEPSEDSSEQSLHTPIIFHVIQLTKYGRVLLLGSSGIPQNLARCGMCGMAFCEGTYESQDAQVVVRMRHILRQPELFREIDGVDLEFQEMWTRSTKRDFAWCGVFDRIWNCGYDREHVARMFSSMPPQLRQATTSLTTGVQRLIEIKQRNERNVHRLEERRTDVPVRDPYVCRLSEQLEIDDSASQDDCRISTAYDDAGRRLGFRITRGFTELLGFSCYDEGMSCFESCRFLVPNTELEIIGNLLNQLQMALAGITDFSTYVRVYRRIDRKAVLVRVDHKSARHAGHGSVVNIMRFTPVSVAEFDLQLAKNPSIVRPFMHAIGDCRRGQELLDSAQEDKERHTLANLRETSQGMQLLANFASIIDGCVGMIVRSSLPSHPQLRAPTKEED